MSAQQRNYDLIGFLSLALVAIAAIAVVLGTPWGLGISPDSVAYAVAARGVVENGDYLHLPTHWPPLYPLLLAGFQELTGSAGLGARLLAGLLMGGNAWLVWRLLRDSEKPAALDVLWLMLIVLQPVFVTPHLFLWSEPAFLSLVLSDLLLLEWALRNPNRTSPFVALSLVAGAAVLVRYAGLFLVVVNGIALLLLLLCALRRPSADSTTESRRLGICGARVVVKRCFNIFVWVGICSLLPLLAWISFNRIRAAPTSIREFAWHPPGDGHLQQALETVSGWFHLPPTLGWFVLFILIAISVATLVLPTKENDVLGNSWRIDSLLGINQLVYISFLVASISLFDFHTPLDGRILLPLYPVFVISLARFAKRGRRSVVVPLAIAVMVGLSLNLQNSYATWRASSVAGLGLASRQIQSMPIMEEVKKFDSNLRIATNGSELFQLYLPQQPSPIPSKLNAGTQLANSAYMDEMRTMAKEADAIVFFSVMAYRYYLPTANDLNGVEGFSLAYRGDDGFIWTRIR